MARIEISKANSQAHSKQSPKAQAEAAAKLSLAAKDVATAREESAVPTWQDLVGYGELKEQWRTLIQAQRLPQVLLLTGRPGVGKRGLLSLMAALHVCQYGDGCGICEACTTFAAGCHPDVLYLGAGEAGGERLRVEDAAQVQEHLALAPMQDGSNARRGHTNAPTTTGVSSGADTVAKARRPAAKARIVIIADADRLSAQASNRLLKVLEEPPPLARIFLSSHRPAAMLVTVLSRCVKWHVPPPPAALSSELIRSRLAAAGLAATPEAVSDLLKSAGLAPGAALRLAGLIPTEPGAPLGAASREEWLGAASREEGVGVARALMQAPSLAALCGEAHALGRSSGWTAADLLGEWELALNQRYQAVHDGRCQRPLNVDQMTRQRSLLKAARRLAIRGQVALNAQLLGESLGMFNSAKQGSSTWNI